MVSVLQTILVGMTIATGIYTVLVVVWVAWVLYRWKDAVSEIEKKFWISERGIRVRMLKRADTAERDLNAARDALSAVYVLVFVLLVLALVYSVLWVFVG